MNDAKSQREIALFRDFASLLALSVGSVSNPNANSPETGMDVVADVDGKRIGVQLTDYHADEDQTKGSRKATLRSQEMKKAKKALLAQSRVKAYGASAPADYIPPLIYRVKEKIKKAANYKLTVDELWLLVRAQDSRYGAASSTFIASKIVNLDALNANLSPLLAQSRFERMFLFLDSERVIYGWNKSSGVWEFLKDKPNLDEESVRQIQKKLFPKGRG